MTPYERLKKAVRDGDNLTALFILSWMDGSLTTLDRIHATDHMDTVQKVLGEAFRDLDAHPEALT